MFKLETKILVIRILFIFTHKVFDDLRQWVSLLKVLSVCFLLTFVDLWWAMEFNGDDESSFEQCYRCYPVTFIEKVQFLFFIYIYIYHVFMMKGMKKKTF